MTLRSRSSITGCKYFSKKEIARKRQKNGHKLFVFIKQMKTIEILLFMEIWKCDYSYKMQRNTFFFTNTFVHLKKKKLELVSFNYTLSFLTKLRCVEKAFGLTICT